MSWPLLSPCHSSDIEYVARVVNFISRRGLSLIACAPQCWEILHVENANLPLWCRKTIQHVNERAIGDCVLAKICYYNAHCNGNSDKWNILDYIDVLLLWKAIGLHVLADDANALYPCTSIRPVLWPGDLVIGPLTLKIIRALYSATIYLCMKFCEAMSKHSWLKRDNFI